MTPRLCIGHPVNKGALDFISSTTAVNVTETLGPDFAAKLVLARAALLVSLGSVPSMWRQSNSAGEIVTPSQPVTSSAETLCLERAATLLKVKHSHTGSFLSHVVGLYVYNSVHKQEMLEIYVCIFNRS